MTEDQVQCSTCGALTTEPIQQCHDCDGERFYYQLTRWRAAAMAAVDALEPRWWERLLRRKRALPSEVAAAVRSARELEEVGR